LEFPWIFSICILCISEKYQLLTLRSFSSDKCIIYHIRFLFNLGHQTTQYLNLMDRFSGNKKARRLPNRCYSSQGFALFWDFFINFFLPKFSKRRISRNSITMAFTVIIQQSPWQKSFWRIYQLEITFHTFSKNCQLNDKL